VVDEHLGGEEQRGYRCGVLQSAAGDLRGSTMAASIMSMYSPAAPTHRRKPRRSS